MRLRMDVSPLRVGVPMMHEPDSAGVAQVPAGVIQAIETMRAPILVSHVVPDADALGSMLSLALALGSKTCTPKVSLPPESVSRRLRFLVEWADAKIAGAEDFSHADGFVVLDTAQKSRCSVGSALKEADWSDGRIVVNIDHHITNTNFGDVNWVVPAAGSTCELVYHLLRSAGRPISSVTASLVFAGIQTDTLRFSLPTTTSSVLRAASDLAALGADIGVLGDRLFRGRSWAEFNLLGTIYANTKVLAGGQLAFSSADYDEIHAAGCTAADIDDQISVPRSLAGVRLAMLFTEGRKGKTRINFRSAGNVTVVDLAAEFDGGGHSQAAGAILDCPLADAIERVVPRALECLKQFPKTHSA